MGPPRAATARAREGLGRLALRVLLALLGFALVWVMDDRWVAARREAAATFEWPTILWLELVGAGVLAGLAFGLAASIPSRFGGYRWGRVLALGVPAIVIVLLGMVSLATLTALNDLPGPLRDAVSGLVGLYGPFLQPAAAIVVGIALASGLAEPRPSPPPGGFQVRPPPPPPVVTAANGVIGPPRPKPDAPPTTGGIPG
jgi:hypothetical protein